ncbi:MAG: LCP family protein [Arachnia sp.]
MHAAHTSNRRLRARRALGLMVMSGVVPGSAQYVVGNRGLGRFAMRVWGGTWVLALLFVVGLLLVRGPVLALIFAPGVTTTLRIAAWVLFAGWVLLLLDAWRLARPARLARPTRLALTLSCVTLVSVMGFTTSVAAKALTAANNVSIVLQGGGDTEANAGRYNILLLGVDAAEDREGIRPDSINVASVDAETGRTVVFGLPRNLQGAPFPVDSPLHSLYPEGYRCDEGACMINGIYTLAEENAELYPDQEAGLAATVEVAGETLGLEINYFAMVDMAGFTHLIDAMGGITLNVGRDVPIGGGGSNVSGYVEAGENVHLDGHDALWLARSRYGSSDYERMTRQKCVMSAMAQQLDASVVATRFLELSEAGKDIVVTDVGAGHVSELADLALKAKALDLQSVDFTPPLITTADPDFALIRSTVVDAVDASEAADDPEVAREQPSTTPLEEEVVDGGASTGSTPQETSTSAPSAEAAEASPEEQPVPEPVDVLPICSVS